MRTLSERKNDLLAQKLQLSDAYNDLEKLIEVSMQQRNESSNKIRAQIGLFLEAVNRNTISLRSTLKKIEVSSLIFKLTSTLCLIIVNNNMTTIIR